MVGSIGHTSLGVTNQDDELEKIQNLAKFIYVILSISGGEAEDLVHPTMHPVRTNLTEGKLIY